MWLLWAANKGEERKSCKCLNFAWLVLHALQSSEHCFHGHEWDTAWSPSALVHTFCMWWAVCFLAQNRFCELLLGHFLSLDYFHPLPLKNVLLFIPPFLQNVVNRNCRGCRMKIDRKHGTYFMLIAYSLHSLLLCRTR